VIEIENVTLEIKHKAILADITVSLDDGKIHGFVGRNGSGKTVLMKCICGFMKPTGGRITVNGKVIGKDCDFPEKTGVIIETPRFIDYYSGLKNLKMLASINHSIDDKRIKEIIEYVGLDPESRLHVGKYSLGMRQRLGLAQAIMEDPVLLILDEPFNGLDIEGVEEMRKYLLAQKMAGKTVIISSHSKEDIDILCDDYIVLDKGKIIENRVSPRISSERPGEM